MSTTIKLSRSCTIFQPICQPTNEKQYIKIYKATTKSFITKINRDHFKSVGESTNSLVG